MRLLAAATSLCAAAGRLSVIPSTVPFLVRQRRLDLSPTVFSIARISSVLFCFFSVSRAAIVGRKLS